MKRVVSAVIAAAFAAVSLAAVAQTPEKKVDAAAQKPATAEKAKEGAAPSTKAEPKADAKPATQPAPAK